MTRFDENVKRFVPVLIFAMATAGFSYHSAVYLKQDVDYYLSNYCNHGVVACDSPYWPRNKR